jgi:radical SAM superfamily enzyme YgiQ (UPF0313 family)
MGNYQMIKIAFVQAQTEYDIDSFKPLSFGYLKAYLLQHLNHKIVFDYKESDDDFSSYDIVGISSTSQSFTNATKLSDSIRAVNQNCIIVFGGHHITYFPQMLPDSANVGVIREGEHVFFELVKAASNFDKTLFNETIVNIKGIAYRNTEGNIVTNPPDNLLLDLDSLPFPVRETKDFCYLFTSRGCPFDCSFCSSTSFWQKTRLHSAERIVAEIKNIIEMYPAIQTISIWDDLFIAAKDRLEMFIELITKDVQLSRLQYSFSVRANLVSEELCRQLSKIKIAGVSFGAESASDAVLSRLNKGVTADLNQKALDILYNNSIKTTCSFILGTPGETESDVRKTYHFIINNLIAGKLTSYSVNILMPLPGTEMWDFACKNNLIDVKSFDWKRLTPFASYSESKINVLDEWINIRKDNKSVYLAAESLSEDRLYELMAIYDPIVSSICNYSRHYNNRIETLNNTITNLNKSLEFYNSNIIIKLLKKIKHLVCIR